MDMTASTMQQGYVQPRPRRKALSRDRKKNCRSTPGRREKARFAIFMSEFIGIHANGNRLPGTRGRMSPLKGILRASCRVAASGLLWMCAVAGARAEMLHVTYSVSLVGLPIGVANLDANLTQSSYTIDARAKITGLAYLFSRARGASSGQGAIVDNRIVPATFATIATNAVMTRTIRMSLSANAVTGVDISPPFDDKPDRVPLTDHDKQGVVDPVGAVVVPVPARGPLVGPASCDRKIPVFDGYTRFDVDLTYVGQRDVSAKGYKGPVAVCAIRYVPIAGHRRDRPSTKFMAENKDLEVWLAPVASAHVLLPFRVSARTMMGTAVIEASEFNLAAE
jgi:hypothetical protein